VGGVFLQVCILAKTSMGVNSATGTLAKAPGLHIHNGALSLTSQYVYVHSILRAPCATDGTFATSAPLYRESSRLVIAR
jgi:hypothetical protein